MVEINYVVMLLEWCDGGFLFIWVFLLLLFLLLMDDDIVLLFGVFNWLIEVCVVVCDFKVFCEGVVGFVFVVGKVYVYVSWIV